MSDRKGGRGQCPLCGEWENNVSYHEVWECPERKLDWLEERMRAIAKLPPPTLEEVRIQLEASEKWRKENLGT